MLLFILYIALGVNASKRNSEETFGNIIIRNYYMSVTCYGGSLDNIAFPWAAFSSNITMADATDCAPPKSYSSALTKLSAKLTNVSYLTLTYYSNSTPPSFEAAYFENLKIETLAIRNYAYSPKIQTNSSEFLKPLVNLRKLRLFSVDAPVLLDNRINIISYWLGKSLGPIGGCQELTYLSLTKWDIELVPQNWLQNCTNLMKIEMINMTRFSPEKLKRTIGGIKSLKDLMVSESGFTEIPADILNEAHHVEELSLVTNIFKNLSLSKLNMRSLSKLYLGYCEITELQGLPQIHVPLFELFLDHNQIKKWRLEKSDYEMLVTKNVVMMLGKYNFELHIDCDCQHAWLIRAIQEDYIIAPDTKLECLNGTTLETIALDVVECDKFECGECTCRRQWSDKTTVARCSGKATRVPRVQALRALYAAGNSIHTLSAHDLPDTLLFIDLRNNVLSNMDKNTTEALFSVSKRRMQLGGNLFACNCDNYLLIEAFQIHKLQVEDYDSLICIQGEEKRAVQDILLSELCAKELSLQRQQILWMTLGVLAVLLGVATVAGVVYWRYRQHIKVYLYARGCCMWCLREDDVDCGRPYDAFLSFSHFDELFVLQELLPRLDTEYKLCLHFRDWVLGDFIPAQITRSVEQSRRTIIVLSKNFLESAWGMLEFRTAHMSALQEGRARLIVVVLDDVVDDENLVPELRGYIKTNTYLRWGDKWFWQRLRYAMPRCLQLAESNALRSPITPIHTLNA